MKYGLSSSTSPRMSAPSSVCSDDSFEIVNNEANFEESKDDVFSIYKPKVTFHQVFDVYPMDSDIVAKVTFDEDYLKSDQDTVVVLPIAWKSVDQALCAANINGSYVRFEVKDLPKIGAEDKFYQFCYCNDDKIVMGVSIPFSFREVHEDELVEFQKEQNNEFWTFRSRFAVLTDYYWNALMEKQKNEEISGKSATNSGPEQRSFIDAARITLEEFTNAAQNTFKETANSDSANMVMKLLQNSAELLNTSNSLLTEVVKEGTSDQDKNTSGEIGDGEPCVQPHDANKLEENATAQNKILLFEAMESEKIKIKEDNEKLKNMVTEMIYAMSKDDRETRRRALNNALNGNGEAFDDDEFSFLGELLRKSFIEPAVLKSPVLESAEANNDLNDSFECVASNAYSNEKILLFKIMENENAELKKQYEEEQALHTDAKNTIKDLKEILLETLSTTSLQDRIRQKIENSLPFISVAFTNEELDEVRELLKKSSVRSLNEMAKSQLGKFEAAFVGTSDGNILLVNECDARVSAQKTNTPDHDLIKELEAKVATLTEERENIRTEVNEQQAMIKNLNEQLINQRQSEVEKMITVTNNMRDQYIKNMSKLTDSNKVLTDQLAEKDKDIETLNNNLLDASKLLTENEREIRDLKARDHTFVGFLERRNLKRISELRETLQEMYSKRWAERQESAKLKEDLLTTQTLLSSLCDELEKSSSSKKSTENSAQTNNDANNVNHSSSSSASESPAPEIPSTSAGFRRIKQREQALATKLVEMTAELEKMKITHEKAKINLETRLKDGAKQYAKLYMKYDKLLKRSQTQSRESSN